MNGKTVIRFSEHILCKLPSMAGDATLAFAGDVRAWIHTSERVVEAMGSTISMCIQHHSIRKLTKEVQAETQNMQEQLNMEEAIAMEKNRKNLSDMQKRMRVEREKLEKYIAEEKQHTEKIIREGVDTEDIDRTIAQDTDHIIKMMRETATAKKSIADARAKKERKQTELYLAKKRVTIEIMRNVRAEIGKAIDLFDEKIRANPILKELPQDVRLRLDEQYHLLIWQFKKNIDV